MENGDQGHGHRPSSSPPSGQGGGPRAVALDVPLLPASLRHITMGRWALGLVVLVCVVFIWVFSGVLMQYIFTDANFDHPFFLTYFSTSLFTFYLLDFLLDVPWRRRPSAEARKVGEERKELIVNLAGDGEDAAGRLPRVQREGSSGSALLPEEEGEGEEEAESGESGHEGHSHLAGERGATSAHEAYTFWQVARTSIIFCPVWFAANYSYNKSLSLTSVSSNTILSSTSSLCTLFLGSFLGVDSFSVGKLISVALSLGGVAIVALMDSNNSGGTDSLLGDMLCLVGAAFYALYVVLLKFLIKDETKLNTRRFFGLVGLFNVLLLWPFGLLLHFTGLEPLALPKGLVWLYLTVNGFIGTVLSDYLWLWAVLLTSPLVATVGLSLTIPLAMLSDIALKGKSFTWLYLLGSALVVGGFLLVNCDEQFLRIQRQARAWIWKKLSGSGNQEVETVGEVNP